MLPTRNPEFLNRPKFGAQEFAHALLASRDRGGHEVPTPQCSRLGEMAFGLPGPNLSTSAAPQQAPVFGEFSNAEDSAEPVEPGSDREGARAETGLHQR